MGNQLALDFLNTRPVPAGEPVELLPDFKALLEWFREANLLTSEEAVDMQKRWGHSSRAGKTMREVQELREKLRLEIVRWEGGEAVHPAMIQELNQLMARHPMRTKLERMSNGLVTNTWFEAREPEDLLAPLVDSAARLFTVADRGRVRKCAHCVAHFQDTSKKGTRRWCSMELCGNRLKVAAYGARHRSRQRL